MPNCETLFPQCKTYVSFYFNDVQRDIFLICSNGMNASPKTSKYHEVVWTNKIESYNLFKVILFIKFWISFVQLNFFQAKHINRYAKGIFEALNADLGLFHSELSLNKRGPSTKQQKEKLIRTPRRVATKCAGMDTCSSFNLHVILTIM